MQVGVVETGVGRHRSGLSQRSRAALRQLVVTVLVSSAAGQDVVEYGLIIATIAIVVLVATVAFGNQIQPWFEGLAGRITTVGT